ncbi:DUF6531 domain-containing protein [Massilia sp. DWR3-1-1]|uniref:DUF6531 domain-containing protein n=1 Tax=Massilia sp. DWR3-1-1 TaxID=2804559 RepID=UPI003CE72F35
MDFATGAETFTHLDFVLAAPLPIEWSRTYSNDLLPFDRGPPEKKKAACPICSGTPCKGRQNPSRAATRFQSSDAYPNKDRWSNVMLAKGTTIYTLYPYGDKPGGFFADESPFDASKKSVSAYHEATQVGHSGKDPDPFQFGPRKKVRAFTLKQDLCVAKAYALANDQYGPGEGTQYYIVEKDRKSMKKVSLMELTSP